MITIKRNDNNPYVSYARLALKRMGYETDETNSYFGETLEKLIMSVQTENGISPDGIVGERTWDVFTPYLKGYTTEIIKPTMTFYNLAKQYETTVGRIKTANPEVNESNLTIGQRIVIPFGFSIVPTNIAYTYELSSILADGLSVRYPFIVAGSAGQSVMGHELDFITIGTGTTHVFYNASHHANEWITTPLLFKFIEDYCEAYATNGEIGGLSAERLYNGKRLTVIPLVNPDGVDLVNGAIAENSVYYEGAKVISEKYPSIPFPNGWKANVLGTDLNLNYPAGWENAKKIKYSQGYTTPAPRDYVGTAPLSAPESDAVYRFTQKNNFSLTLSYHTQGEVIYWKYLNYNPPRALEIGKELSRVSGYTLELTPSESGYAGYKDWFIYYYDLPGYTIEVGKGENPLPITQFEKIYADNLPLLVTALDMA